MMRRKRRLFIVLSTGVVLVATTSPEIFGQPCVGPESAVTDSAGGFYYSGGTIIGGGYLGGPIEGLFPRLSSDVCSNIVYVENVGDILPCPEGVDCLTQPVINPAHTQRAFWHEVEQQLYAIDTGNVEVTWNAAGGGTIKKNYQVLNEIPTVHLFLTDNAPNDGPPVDLTELLGSTIRPATAIIQYNTQIVDATDAWIDVSALESVLRARKTGTMVLEYDHSITGELIGLEVVRILNPLSGPERRHESTVDVASALQPAEAESCVPSQSGCVCIPHVASGIKDGDPANTYAYQHTAAAPGDGPTLGNIWATKPTGGIPRITVYWYEEGLDGVCWPTERHTYIAQWPSAPQINVRGTPESVPALPGIDMTAHDQARIHYRSPPNHASITSRRFDTIATGVATVMYTDLSAEGYTVSFEAVETVDHTVLRTTADWDIGERILDASHDASCNDGFLFAGTNYDPSLYAPASITGIVFPVNTGQIEMWWYETSQDVCWPVSPILYECGWPAMPDDCIIIANENGVGPYPPTKYLNPSIYEFGEIDSASTALGYNPNEEHAEWNESPGDRIVAARDDLNALHGRSDPYVLLRYQDHLNGDAWEFDVIRVTREVQPGSTVTGCSCDEEINGPCTFDYERIAGQPLQPPVPLSLTTPYCAENTVITEPVSDYLWSDEKDSPSLYFIRGGEGLDGTVNVVARYYENWRSGGCEPWLDDGTEIPIDVAYDVRWPQYPTTGLPETPDHYRTVPAGETVILDFKRAEILYNEAGAAIIVPFATSEVALSPFPGDFIVYSGALPPDLRVRLNYAAGTLIFRGDSDEGLLGIMSERDRDVLLSVYQETYPGHPNTGDFAAAVDALYADSQQPGSTGVGVTVDDTGGGLALASGPATSTGWVVLGFNAGTDKPSSSVVVYRVECPLYQGGIQVVYPDCPFDEQITLRWTGDCGGDCKDMDFYWQVAAGDNPDDFKDVDPDDPPGTAPEVWEDDYVDPERGFASGWVRGQNEITVKGANPCTLSDNWFHVRTRIPLNANPPDVPCPPGTMSDWTEAMLAEGWLKRVKRGINPFDQRIKDFTDDRVATYVSMIEQLGAPLEDVLGLSCDAETVNGLGLIEMYQAVLLRGRSFTIDLGVNYPPANQALMLMAGSLADFYMLLGNEAYGDAQDPTIAIDVGTNADASVLFCFDNMVPDLLQEELGLLRGRDDEGEGPVYNRLIHNFTLEQGQVAYVNNYNIQDVYPRDPDGADGDGFIDARDAQLMFPQGHGDAWGHYLSGLRFYYQLRRDEDFDWPVRTESVLVNNVPVDVSYKHERKFARLAAAKAKTGAEIVNLTYRAQYVEDPSAQWQGYEDPIPDRNWGVTDWARRSFVGAYFDWATVSSAIPAIDDDPTHEGTVKKIDRTTVPELREIVTNAMAIQDQLNQADAGLSPLGLAKNVVPFDISPPGPPPDTLTHFEQIYNRAVQSLNNAIAVFNYANESSRSLRQHQDEYSEFESNYEDREADFTNRLIEIFGYPYPDDENPLTGLKYGSDFVGPDLYHFDYVDVQELTGLELPEGKTLSIAFKAPVSNASGVLSYETTQPVEYNIVPGFGLVKPVEFTRPRRAPGEVQLARSDMIQAIWRLQRALIEYDNTLNSIEDQADAIEEQFAINEEEISVLVKGASEVERLNDLIETARTDQLDKRRQARTAQFLANALAEALPTAVGLTNDPLSPVRSQIRVYGGGLAEGYGFEADMENIAELQHQQAKEEQNNLTNIELTTLRQGAAIDAEIRRLEQMIRALNGQQIEICSLIGAIQQSSGRYRAAIERGSRLWEERTRFRQKTAALVSKYRYKDMAFRIFRNDALQKYRAQFDLAARYVYLAAKAYGYETNLLHSDSRGGEQFLSDIVRKRTIGRINDGVPVSGGLSGVLRQLKDNFNALEGPLRFNNPEIATNKFSLRRELFRVKTGLDGSETWREQLRRCIVDDLRTDLPEYAQYCSAIPDEGPQPAIVIEFGSQIIPRMNFFVGWDLVGGDSFFPSDYFSIKIRSVGVWFSNYDSSGLVQTPYVYLVPVGADVMREPSDLRVIREWNIVDQVMPLPFRLTTDDPTFTTRLWLPGNQLSSPLLAPKTRRHGSIRAYHDAGDPAVDPSELTYSTSLVGRSVWNTRWLLIIPGSYLLGEPDLGIDYFINGPTGTGGISDIRVAFQTYQYTPSTGKPSADGERADEDE